MRKTKIIATIGPSSSSEDVLYEMVRKGVDAFRFNFAHGTYEEKLRCIRIIRKVEKLTGKYISIIGDLQGPVIRLGDVDTFLVRKGEKVKVVKKRVGKSEEREVPIPSEELFDTLEEGDTILIESGRMAVKLDKVSDDVAYGRSLLDGSISSRKTVAIKGKDLPLPTLSEKDLKDADFISKNDFDYIGLSFVRSVEDVKRLREFLEERDASEKKIISKIETRKGVESIYEITKESDAIMVARGDLAIYYELQKIPYVQEKIVEVSRSLGRPVIIATQLLESMINNPMPTRAEVMDVSNAVWEGVDALMVSGETTVGKYPIECITWLDRIIREAERMRFLHINPKEETVYDNFVQGIVEMAKELRAKIVAYTREGTTGFRLARYRPEKPFYVFTPNIRVARQLSLLWGARPLLTDEKDPDDAFPKVVDYLKEKGELKKGDIVILTAGMTAGTTDTIKVEKI
ncbi:MAG: pyruvate kinase [Candidatus Asgardarchaeia archaeon]